jgi:quinol monooxygenase YgiN
MAITVVLEMQVEPEKVDDFLSVMATALKDTRAFPGCRSVVTLQDAEDPGRILLWEEWETREDDQKYREWRQTPEGAVQGLADLVTARSISYLNQKPGV